MLEKLLEDLVENIAGTGSGRIVQTLFKKKDVNEFIISKKMNMTINQVRNILYKLSAEGLVTFVRKKDKRKGWYTYYWTLKIEKCLEQIKKELMKKIESLEFQLNSRETKRFYICHPCSIEVNEEKALEHNFTCEECAEVYVLSDSAKPIKEIKMKISRIKRQLETINEELEKVRKKSARAKKRKETMKKNLEAKRKKLKKPVKKPALKKEKRNKTPKKAAKKQTKKKVKKLKKPYKKA